jgi:hypothetical protein
MQLSTGHPSQQGNDQTLFNHRDQNLRCYQANFGWILSTKNYLGR